MTTQTQNPTPADDDLNNIIHWKKVPKHFPDTWTESQWAWCKTNRAKNGLASAFIHIGKTLYVNKQRLAICMNAQREAA